MSFQQNNLGKITGQSRNYVTVECDICNKFLCYADIEWSDGLPETLCKECFKKKGYPINEKIFIETQDNREVKS